MTEHQTAPYEALIEELSQELMAPPVEALAQLLPTLISRSEAFGPQNVPTQSFELQSEHEAWLTARSELSSAEANARLWQRDASLLSPSPSDAAAINNRLGWLTIPQGIKPKLDALTAFATEARRAGFRKVLLLGMGGSSLCAQVFKEAHPRSPSALELRVLDSVAPQAVLEAAEWATPEHTLFVVASKSGTTTEVLALEAFFYEQVKAALAPSARGGSPGNHFVAITDPGTPLLALAERRGYFHIFKNDPSIGGRYSALSYFGLVPAALMGVELSPLLQSAEAMQAACAPSASSDENPGELLAAYLVACHRAGRNKLGIISSKEISGFGGWIEQLVAESTGKAGLGIVPIDKEPLGPASAYAEDRAFVYLRLKNASTTPLDLQVKALSQAGFPVARLELQGKPSLGGQFWLWELATVLASALLGVNPLDEPNVAEAKQATQSQLERYATQSGLEAPISDAERPSALSELLAQLKPPHYLAVCAFLPQTPSHDQLLAELRLALRDRFHVATTLGYGPRYLHSTGQLHKGGPPQNIHLLITQAGHPNVEIPGENYSLGTLLDAQAFGDYSVLKNKGRPLLHLRLNQDIEAGLSSLVRAIKSHS